MSPLEQALRSAPRLPLLGLSVHRYDPAFVDMAALVGFDVVWYEMEHAPGSFAQACDFCRIAAGAGLLSLIRIPDTRRENVLKAAECGPDILDLPMGNSPEIVAELVNHARYAPQGNRGFFGSSRALNYGFYESIGAQQQLVNERLTLMSQIETREAVERAEELCAVPGLDAIFLGLGDLSTSLGLLGQTRHAVVQEAADRAIAAARAAGKRVAVAGAAGDARHWASKGADLLFCGSDMASLKIGLQAIHSDAQRSLDTV